LSIKYLQDVLDSGQFTSADMNGGKYVQKLERTIRDFTGAKYCVVVNSGTSALYASLLALNIDDYARGVHPSFTFKATRNVIDAVNGIPYGIDVRKEDMTLDPNDMEWSNKSIKYHYMIPVHLYGHIADMPALKEKGIPIIEDCCQALGSRLNGKHVGLFGDVGCFSFYPSKIINGGEGGCVITNNKRIADKLKVLRNHGKGKQWGLNLRMSEIHAAIAFGNMEKINKILETRKKNAKILSEIFKDETQYYPRKGEYRNNQLFTITVKNRKKFMEKYPQSRIYYDYTLGYGENSEWLSKHCVSFATDKVGIK